MDSRNSLLDNCPQLQPNAEINPWKELKSKIISTHLIIRKYQEKCAEFEESSSIRNKLQNDCTKYENDLREALKELQPTKRANDELQQLKQNQEGIIISLKEKLKAAEILTQQYSELVKNTENDKSKDVLQVEKEFATKLKKLEKFKDLNKKLQDDVRKSNSKLTQVQNSHNKALKTLVRLGENLKKINSLNKTDQRAVNHYKSLLHKTGETEVGESSDSADNDEDDDEKFFVEVEKLESLLSDNPMDDPTSALLSNVNKNIKVQRSSSGYLSQSVIDSKTIMAHSFNVEKEISIKPCVLLNNNEENMQNKEPSHLQGDTNSDENMPVLLRDSKLRFCENLNLREEIRVQNHLERCIKFPDSNDDIEMQEDIQQPHLIEGNSNENIEHFPEVTNTLESSNQTLSEKHKTDDTEVNYQSPDIDKDLKSVTKIDVTRDVIVPLIECGETDKMETTRSKNSEDNSSNLDSYPNNILNSKTESGHESPEFINSSIEAETILDSQITPPIIVKHIVQNTLEDNLVILQPVNIQEVAKVVENTIEHEKEIQIEFSARNKQVNETSNLIKDISEPVELIQTTVNEVAPKAKDNIHEVITPKVLKDSSHEVNPEVLEDNIHEVNPEVLEDNIHEGNLEVLKDNIHDINPEAVNVNNDEANIEVVVDDSKVNAHQQPPLIDTNKSETESTSVTNEVTRDLSETEITIQPTSDFINKRIEDDLKATERKLRKIAKKMRRTSNVERAVSPLPPSPPVTPLDDEQFSLPINSPDETESTNNILDDLFGSDLEEPNDGTFVRKTLQHQGSEGFDTDFNYNESDMMEGQSNSQDNNKTISSNSESSKVGNTSSSNFNQRVQDNQPMEHQSTSSKEPRFNNNSNQRLFTENKNFNSRLKADLSHNSETGHYSISIKLPDSNHSTTSLHVELDTVTKELSLDYRPYFVNEKSFQPISDSMSNQEQCNKLYRPKPFVQRHQSSSFAQHSRNSEEIDDHNSSEIESFPSFPSNARDGNLIPKKLAPKRRMTVPPLNSMPPPKKPLLHSFATVRPASLNLETVAMPVKAPIIAPVGKELLLAAQKKSSKRVLLIDSADVPILTKKKPLLKRNNTFKESDSPKSSTEIAEPITQISEENLQLTKPETNPLKLISFVKEKSPVDTTLDLETPELNESETFSVEPLKHSNIIENDSSTSKELPISLEHEPQERYESTRVEIISKTSQRLSKLRKNTIEEFQLGVQTPTFTNPEYFLIETRLSNIGKVLENNVAIEKVLNSLHKLDGTKKNEPKIAQDAFANLSNPTIVKNANALVEASIVQMLRSKKNLIINKNSTCILTSFESSFPAFLFYLEANKELFKGVVQTFKESANALVLSKKNSTLQGLAAVCRMLTIICKHTGDIQMARIFCYNLVTEKCKMAIYLVANMIQIWPDVLISNKTGERDYLLDLMFNLLLTQPNIVPAIMKKRSEVILIENCPLSINHETDIDFEDMTNNLLQKLKRNQTATESFQTIRCFELLSFKNGWAWTKKLIDTSLMVILNDLTLSNDQKACDLIKLLGVLIRRCPMKSVNDINNVLQMFIELLQAQNAQKVIIESTLFVMLYSKKFMGEMLKETFEIWLKNFNKNDLSPNLQEVLKYCQKL